MKHWACKQYPAWWEGSTNLGKAHGAQSPPQVEIERETELQMVLLVRPTPTRFPTNNFYTAVDNTPLHSIPSVTCARGGGL